MLEQNHLTPSNPSLGERLRYGIIVYVGGGAILCLLGILVLAPVINFGRSVRLAREVSSFQPADAVVLQASYGASQTRSGRLYHIYVSYRFSANGTLIDSNSANDPIEFNNEQVARRWIENHPVGSTLRVYYSPQQPQRSTLRRSIEVSWVEGLLSTVPLLMLLTMVVSLLRKRPAGTIT